MDKTQPLNVIIPRYAADMGGVTSHIGTLIEWLKAQNHQVVHWASPKPTTATKAWLYVQAGLDTSRARQANIRSRQRSILCELDKLEVPQGYRGLVHTHDVFAAQAALQHSGFKVVHTVHGPASREALMDHNDQRSSRYIHQIEAEVYRRAHRLIAVDKGQAAILEQDFAIPGNRVTVIRNAVDGVAVKRQAEAQSNLSLVLEAAKERASGKRIVLVPRRLVEKNGVHWAIQSLSLLPERYVFWIAGDGPMKENIRAYIAKMGFHQRVKLLGDQQHSAVLGLMLQSDIVLIPSIPAHGVVEATSIAALEAMALAKPVVASRIGGLAEMIKDNSTGLLFSPDNLEELAKTLLALEDEALAGKLQENAALYVEQEWSVEGWGNSILHEYLQALG